MLMGRGNEFQRSRNGRFAASSEPAPGDFDEVFVRIGRVACEEHYQRSRQTIDRWLQQSGKDRLVRLRAEHVVRSGNVGSNAVRVLGREEVNRLRDQQKHLTLSEMARILSRSFPVEDDRTVSHELASAAAHHLRIRCNGGFYVSPTGEGDWWVGLRRRSSAELLDMAKARGFRPASLTGGEG